MSLHTLFLAIILVSPPAMSSVDGNLKAANQVWSSVAKCFGASQKNKKDAELIMCAHDFLDRQLASPVKQKILEPFDMQMGFSKLHECSESDLIQPTKVLPQEMVFCFTLPAKTYSGMGYARFRKIDGTLKISELKYRY